MRVFVSSVVVFTLIGSLLGGPNFNELANGHAKISPTVTFTGIPSGLEANEYLYQGVRYGMANRFEDSVVNTNYSYLTLITRPLNGYLCPQATAKAISEDCLYLDIYVPPVEAAQTKRFPVLVFAVGGAFNGCDKDFYNGSLLAAAIDAIVIVPNYRVGDLGFLSSGDGTVRGNYGLSDIKTALNWVEQNIVHFGGNKNKITLFGESAGGDLVSAAFLDAQVRDQVQAAMAMSGSTLSRWGDHTSRAPANYQTVRTLVGCNQTTSGAQLACLKSVSYSAFPMSNPYIRVGPVVDGVHIQQTPINAIHNQSTGSAVFINGNLRQDDAFFVYGGWSGVRSGLFATGGLNYTIALGIITQQLSVRGAVLGAFPLAPPCPAAMTTLVQQVADYYNLSPADNETTLRTKTMAAVTASWFEIPAVREAQAYASRVLPEDVPNYYYVIDYTPGFRNLGAFHTLDVILLFRGNLDGLMGPYGVTVSEDATAGARKYLRQIAHHGKPHGKPVGLGAKVHYRVMDQNGDWNGAKKDFSADIALWNTVSAFTCP